MKKRRHKPKADLYAIIERAVEEGARGGYCRAFKHTEKPDEDLIVDNIVEYIMLNLCEVLDFDAT